jgi:hypothetical protein
MGQEIATSYFTPADFERFGERLRAETALLTQWFEQGLFVAERQMAGFELEAWLVGKDFLPAPVNERFLHRLTNPLVVPELARFNVEINATPHRLEGGCLSALHAELEQTWLACNRCAAQIGAEMVMIGILPTLQDDVLSLENMSPLRRYYALNEQVLRRRQGRPLCLDIQGRDHLVTCHQDVMLESATTSLQIHLQVSPDEAVRFYNAAQILSAPMVAVAANAPYLFGRDLWDDTRIPLFEQSVALETARESRDCSDARVTFGSGYARRSLFECFQENVDCYPVLLPIVFSREAAQLEHVRLHNGTIWRWNRPLIGFGEDGRAHLRIEHRVASAGPSIADVIANIALFLGSVHVLATRQPGPESELNFSQVRANFYRAARDGLRSSVTWLKGAEVPLRSLLLESLLPMARRGLQALGLEDDARLYLGEIMEPRVRSGCNGAAWQRAFVAKHRADMRALAAEYVARQRSGLPVHEWDV